LTHSTVLSTGFARKLIWTGKARSLSWNRFRVQIFSRPEVRVLRKKSGQEKGVNPLADGHAWAFAENNS
jgi:hypothetical protein